MDFLFPLDSESTPSQSVGAGIVSGIFSVALASVAISPAPIVTTWLTPSAAVRLAQSPVVSTYSLPAPSVVIGAVNASAPIVSGSWSQPSASVAFGVQVVSGGPAVGTFSIPAPTTTTGPLVVPAPITIANFSIGSPGIITYSASTPSSVLGSWTVLSPTISPSVVSTPSTILASWNALDAHGFGQNQAIAASTISATFSLPDTAVSGAGSTSPPSVMAVWSLPVTLGLNRQSGGHLSTFASISTTGITGVKVRNG